MSEQRAERCGNCRFWDDHDDCGMCRRHAPRLVMAEVELEENYEPYQAQNAVWPWTHPGDWCGEYQPAPKDPGPRVPLL